MALSCWPYIPSITESRSLSPTLGSSTCAQTAAQSRSRIHRHTRLGVVGSTRRRSTYFTLHLISRTQCYVGYISVESQVLFAFFLWADLLSAVCFYTFFDCLHVVAHFMSSFFLAFLSCISHNIYADSDHWSSHTIIYSFPYPRISYRSQHHDDLFAYSLSIFTFSLYFIHI
jgi:hypothetical protein